jgi:CheY-like chemotaxis protein
VVLPVLFEGEVKAVVELASFHRFNKNHLAFLDQLTESIGIVLNSIEANMRTEALLSQSQGLTQELQSQQEELQQTNRRLEEQARSLRESEELLRQQQDELQGTNVELEQKARQLAEQNAEVERKNAEIEQARAAIEEKAEQLALTSKYKSEFLANMSHELRTPLNSMLILSRMLAENPGGVLSPKQVEYAETIHSSGSDLLGLINEILDLSKIESGAMPVEVERVRLGDVADETDRTFREVANTRGLAFEITVADGAPATVETDPKRLQQVLKNLLSNAFKFTHEGSVALRVAPAEGVAFRTAGLRAADRVVGFSVADTGIGIEPSKQRVIFEAFQQADGSVDRTYGGTGLGLSISREIARLLGGEIHLTSAPGEGSTFTLYLPQTYTAPTFARDDEAAADEHADGAVAAAMGDGVAGPAPRPPADEAEPDATERDAAEPDATERDATEADPPNAAPDEPAAVRTPAASGAASPAAGSDVDPAEIATLRALPRRVDDDRDEVEPGDPVLLVVEDDPAFAGILVEIAREKGFKAVVAEHAEAALEAVRRYAPAAITLDMHLPGMHGLTLLDRLKSRPETRHIPVQIVSVSDALPRRERKGALAPLQKPVERAAVGAGIDRAGDLAGRAVKRLLVIEDDETQRQIVEDLVGGDDVEVVAVGTGQEGLDALGGGPFDCAVVDLGLPDINGLDFVERVRGELGLADLPLVVHTGRDLASGEAERLHALAEAVVVKDVEAFDRLLDETALYLHRDERRLSDDQRERLARRHRPETRLAGRKVLIVDDDVRNIFALQSLLEEHKMEVVYAENGRDGIAMLRDADDVDVVLMDIMMPGMDGYQTTQAIREIDRFRDLPIIAVTAKAMKGDREKCLAAGASDYLTKPVNVDQLVSLLRVWVGKGD